MDSKDDESKQNTLNQNELNVNSKEFIPKTKSQLKKQENIPQSNSTGINLNSNQQNTYVTKDTSKENSNLEKINKENIEPQPNEIDQPYEDEEEKEFADKIFSEMMEENINLDEEDEESDDEKWFPKYRNCECCKGFVYKCEGETCRNLGKCYCKIKAQMDGDIDY